MNIKILGILVVLAVLAVGGVWLTGGEEPEGQVITQQQLVPGLEESINAVDRLRLVEAGDELVAELARGEAGWVVANRDNYPANLGQIRETLLNLADSRLMEEKTGNPEFYERLGVSAVDEPEAGGILLELSGLDETPLALIIGDPAQGAAGTYVRRADEDRSWLASGALTLSRSVSDWLDTQVVDIPAREIQSLSIQHPDGETLSLEKTVRTQTDFDVVDLPEGRELSSQGSVNALGSALAGLNLEDVRAGDAVQAEAPVRVSYRSFEGLVLEAEVFQQDEGRYLRFLTVDYDEDLARRFAPTSEEASADEEADTGAEETTAELDEAAIAAGRERAEDLAGRISGWAYQIPGQKYDNMNKRLTALLKPLEEAAPAAEDTTEELVPILPEQG